MKATIVFDLEATCEDRAITPRFDNEIIEIGAVKVIDGVIVDEFQTFVRPVRTRLLTAFCQNLTSISQQDVDGAPEFPEALEAFRKWAAKDVSAYTLASWGFYDRKQIEKDARHHGVSWSELRTHRSLKHEYQEIRRLKRPIGMKGALQKEGIPLDGTHHRGIDDARNIAKIYIAAFDA